MRPRPEPSPTTVGKNSSPRPEQVAPTEGLLKTFAASLLALLTGLVMIFVTTDHGQAFTTENLRRAQVNREPQQIPNFALTDAAGRTANLHEMLADDGRIWIVDFVYTRCQTVCSSLGSVYQQLQQQILERGVQGRVGLLSISFDPVNDDAAALRDYAARMRMDPGVWGIATLASWQDRRRLLDSFGIMVVPAPLGEFEHNAALHLVDSRGRLIRIVDYDAPGRALEVALAVTR